MKKIFIGDYLKTILDGDAIKIVFYRGAKKFTKTFNFSEPVPIFAIKKIFQFGIKKLWIMKFLGGFSCYGTYN